MESDQATTEAPGPCRLRIFHLNDVYELGNLPRFKTCLEEKRTGQDLVLLAGDFLAPSVQSSLDKGRGMVDLMNRVGVEYVCFGNHEADVPYPQLLQRIKESQFQWINTNMQRIPLGDLPPLPTHAVLTVSGGGQTRKVGLLGLNTPGPGLYRPDAWGGLGQACVDPIVDKAREFRQKLLQEEGVDLVVPMTHQLMPEDRQFAELKMGFPLIIGGHDHEPYLETVAGAVITKQGCDAKLVGVIDVTWPSAETPGDRPEISVQQLPITDFAPDPAIEEVAERHGQVLKALEVSELCTVPKTVNLSSKGVRLHQTTMGTLVCSTLRDALGADCAIIDAGNIRGDKDYGDRKVLTYSDLKSEIPFDSPVVVLPLPGSVINESVSFSRSFAAKAPPVEKGMFMQLDDLMGYDAAAGAVTSIQGRPLEPERIYQTVVLWQVAAEGIDGVAPLVRYVEANRDHLPIVVECSRPAKEVLVDYFSRAVWWGLVQSAGFGALDTDHDGKLSRAELVSALQKTHGEQVGAMVVDNLMGLADSDGDGVITKKEMLDTCVLCAAVFAQHHSGEDISAHELEEHIRRLFGALYEESLLQKLLERVGVDGAGGISFDRLKKIAKELEKSEHLTI